MKPGKSPSPSPRHLAAATLAVFVLGLAVAAVRAEGIQWTSEERGPINCVTAS